MFCIQLPAHRCQVLVACSLSLTFIMVRSTGLAVTWILWDGG